jgi:hypothetical protein
MKFNVRIRNKKSRKHILLLCEKIWEEFLIRGVTEDHDIVVDIKWKDLGVGKGECGEDDGKIEVILQKEMGNCATATVIAHELRHVAQFASKRLQVRAAYKTEGTGKGWSTVWEGKYYEEKGVAYKDLPWEVEAFETENIGAEVWFSLGEPSGMLEG